MKFKLVQQLEKREKQEAILVPFWETEGQAKEACPLKEFEKAVRPAVQSKDFKGKEGEILPLYIEGEKEKRLLLFGLGKEQKCTVESLRRAFGLAARFCHKRALKSLNIVFPKTFGKLPLNASVKGICEGLLLANYTWSLKEKKEPPSLLEEVTFIGVASKVEEIIEECKQVAEAIYFTRDLINGNADMVTPGFLVETAKRLAKQFSSLKVTALGKKEIEKEGLGLLQAVSRGSSHDPALIILQYENNPRSKEKTVLVGKGITFDTGGLNLKLSNMDTMRDDMSGGALVMGTLAAVAALGLKINVVGVIPTCENAIDAKSYKPGDVYKSYLGKTVEIGDTDAEGRLILADALAYSVKNLAPTAIVDFATLTGSIVVALGDHVAGLFSNSDKIAKGLEAASEETGELLWRMPLHAPYKEQLKSDIADLKNVGGRPGGSIKAALFLEEFVADIPWAHLDIAGTAFSNKENAYLPKNGVGYGVRLTVEFLKKIKK